MIWLERVYAAGDRGDIDDALDIVFEYTDALFCAGRFEECDAELQFVDVERLDASLLIGFLASTLLAGQRGKLPSRADFVRRVEARLLVIAPDRVERLLVGLR